MGEVEARAHHVNNATVWRALQNCVDPDRTFWAADYSVQWFVGVNAYYVCLGGAGDGGGGEGKCGTVTISQHWGKFKEDTLATGRR